MLPSIRSFLLANLAYSTVAQNLQEHDALMRRAEETLRQDGQVSWTSWTSGDGEKTGKDPDGVYYIQTFIEKILAATPDSNERNLVFWAGGQENLDDVDEFTESETRMPNGGKQFTDIFGQQIIQEMGLTQGTALYYRAINRMSKALAASATNGKAYVYLRDGCGPTLFSPPSKSPSNKDPTAGDQATNGEIFYYAELPTLMRNLNINQIYTFYKAAGSNKFSVDLAWDASNPGQYTRTSFNDMAMDAAPIEFPDRGPLKRNALPSVPAQSSKPIVPYYPGGNSSSSGLLGTGTGTGSLTTSKRASSTYVPSGSSSSSRAIGSIGGSSYSIRPTGHSPSSSLLATGHSPSSSSSSSVPGRSSYSRSFKPTGYLSSSGLPGTSYKSSSSSSIAPLQSFSSSRSYRPTGYSSLSSGLPGTGYSSSSPSYAAAPSSSSSIVPASSSSGYLISSSPNSLSSSGFAPSQSVPAVTSSAPAPSSSNGVYGTLDPSGTEASSSAQDIKTSIVGIIPIIESYTRDPDPPGATAVIEAIEKIQPVVDDFFKQLDPTDQEGSDCTGGNLIASLFAAAKCAVNELEDTITNIETEIDNNFEDMTLTDDITPILSNIGDSLDNPDDPDDPDQSTTQSSSQTQSSSASCSGSVITTSVCDTFCVTPTPASGSTYPASASLTSMSCTTTCPVTTITGCSVSIEPESSTTTRTISGGACGLPTSASGPYTTAWFDWAISCAGAGCSNIGTPGDVPDYSVSAPASASALASGSASSRSLPPSSYSSSIPARTSSAPISQSSSQSAPIYESSSLSSFAEQPSASSSYPGPMSSGPAPSSSGAPYSSSYQPASSSFFSSYIGSGSFYSSYIGGSSFYSSYIGGSSNIGPISSSIAPLPSSASYFYSGSYLPSGSYFSSAPYYPSASYSVFPTSTAAAPVPSSTYDPNSPDCTTCGSNLGASNCAADDDQCLVDQCNADSSCTACGIDCSQYASV